MKKLLLTIASALLVLTLVGCSTTTDDQASTTAATTTASPTVEPTVLKVAATLDPHSKILEFAKPILLSDYNIDLEITVLDDYYVFNQALDNEEIDANYFQHRPFFDNEVSEKGYDITEVAGIHIEPFGFYSKNIASIDELEDGDKIVISDSVSDHGRILSILDKAGVITLDPEVAVIDATVDDIIDNPKNLTFVEVKPELLTVSYENKEGAMVAINGNYAIQAGLNPTEDSVLLEQADETNPYVNIVACKTGHENDEAIQALVTVLKSDAVKDFILETYSDGSVIPAE